MTLGSASPASAAPRASPRAARVETALCLKTIEKYKRGRRRAAGYRWSRAMNESTPAPPISGITRFYLAGDTPPR